MQCAVQWKRKIVTIGNKNIYNIVIANVLLLSFSSARQLWCSLLMIWCSPSYRSSILIGRQFFAVVDIIAFAERVFRIWNPLLYMLYTLCVAISFLFFLFSLNRLLSSGIQVTHAIRYQRCLRIRMYELKKHIMWTLHLIGAIFYILYALHPISNRCAMRWMCFHSLYLLRLGFSADVVHFAIVN